MSPLNKFEESNVPQISNTLKYFVELIFGYHSSHLHIHLAHVKLIFSTAMSTLGSCRFPHISTKGVEQCVFNYLVNWPGDLEQQTVKDGADSEFLICIPCPLSCLPMETGFLSSLLPLFHVTQRSKLTGITNFKSPFPNWWHLRRGHQVF